MTTITVGPNSTLKSSTAESQLIELLGVIENLESVTATNPTNANNIRLTASFDAGTVAASFTLPASQAITNGVVSVQAISYLTNTNFVGGNGTIKSTTVENYLLELVSYLQILENSAVKNPQQENRVGGSFDFDSQTFSGSVSLNCEFSPDANGQLTITVSEYLLD